MAVVANLVNPTPFDVAIPYTKGIEIRVPADGEVNLTMQQLDDFRPGKPGSEETQGILDFEGVYLQDSDLSYDFQALAALKAFVLKRKDRIKTFTDRTKGSRVAGGVAVDDDSMAELLDQAGYTNMQAAVDKVVLRIQILEKIVSADETRGSVKLALDPERTCFVTNPPRQFPSKTALAMFLSEHPEIAVKHEALINPVETVVEPVAGSGTDASTGYVTNG
jgi:hypothetical protein